MKKAIETEKFLSTEDIGLTTWSSNAYVTSDFGHAAFRVTLSTQDKGDCFRRDLENPIKAKNFFKSVTIVMRKAQLDWVLFDKVLDSEIVLRNLKDAMAQGLILATIENYDIEKPIVIDDLDKYHADNVDDKKKEKLDSAAIANILSLKPTSIPRHWKNKGQFIENAYTTWNIEKLCLKSELDEKTEKNFKAYVKKICSFEKVLLSENRNYNKNIIKLLESYGVEFDKSAKGYKKLMLLDVFESIGD